jgi:glycolate oxidase FAD binding subunit
VADAAAVHLESIRQKLQEMVSGPFAEIRKDSSPMGNDGRIVVSPANESEVSAIMRFAWENGLTVNPVGGGTKAGRGGTQERTDILLSLRRMAGIVDYAAADLTMTALPGTPIADIEKTLEKNGQYFPLDVPWPEEATLGGVVAANESGIKRIRNGSARDMVIGMRVVYPDGRVIRTGGRVVKNVAGYDMNKLWIGSMGTIGVITEVTIKVRPRPAWENVILVRSDSIDPLGALCADLLDSFMEPAALELLNPAFFQCWSGEAGYGLIVAFEDVEKAVRYQTNWLKERTAAHGMQVVRVIEGEDTKSFWHRIRTFSPMREAHTVWIKAGVWLTEVPWRLRDADAAAKEHGLELYAHGGAGTGIMHFLLHGVREERFSDAAAFLQKVRTQAEQQGGYAVVNHAALAFRRLVDLWGNANPAMRLVEGVKRMVDPKGIMNPGRFVGGI